jgi:hypothetical protein
VITQPGSQKTHTHTHTHKYMFVCMCKYMYYIHLYTWVYYKPYKFSFKNIYNSEQKLYLFNR